MRNPIYNQAKKRVKQKKRFFNHLIVYCVFNVIFFFVIFFDSGTFGWLVPASFWAMGLLIHYFTVFGLPGTHGVGGVEWEAKQMRKEVLKLGGSLSDIPEEHLDLREIHMLAQGWEESELV